jgi:AraC family transcriptional regulator
METNPIFNLQYSEKRLGTLVENRTAYTLNNVELNVFETYEYAAMVELRFREPILASMLRGKKVMHLRDENSFEFYPNESVILPPNELMRIDFPEATPDNPTQCLALSISPDKINSIVNLLNETQPRAENHSPWRFTDYNFHFTNDAAVNQILGRMIYVFIENHPSKDIFADLMLHELIIRLMQTETRHLFIDNAAQFQDTCRLAFIAKYIQDNLHEPLSIECLSRKACMSQSHFFRCFKAELGISPVDYINFERIKKAMIVLKDVRKSINQVCLECGFNNVSYFNKLFKRQTHLTPTEYRQKHIVI